MIIKHGTTIRSINQDSLPTWSIDGSMALKDLRATRAYATRPSRIDIRTTGTAAPADPDRILLTGGGLVGVIAAADTGAEEEVIVRAAVVDEATLQGVVAGAVVCDLVARGGGGLWRIFHWGLVNFVHAKVSKGMPNRRL